MKRLVVSLFILAASLVFVACSKDKDNNNHNPYGYGNGMYGSTPNDPRCGNGMYPGFNYGRQPHGFYGNNYYGNVPQNINCIPQGAIHGGNPYYFQANFQFYLGTCDLRFSGRSQLCPIGYQCRPAFGTMGVCMRGY